MPEEINRILTDRITDIHFATEQSAMDNLQAEGFGGTSHFVGNTMIDTLVGYDDQIQSSDILQKLGVSNGEYYLMTMHRPANVDHEDGLIFLHKLVEELAKDLPVVFPFTHGPLSVWRPMA